MSSVPPNPRRSVLAKPDAKGKPSFEWTLTHTSLTDTVDLIAGPFDVLPIVFVPGIMGSNLKAKRGGAPVWRLDISSLIKAPLGLAWDVGRKGPGARQAILHPAKCEVDDGGAVPKKELHSATTYSDRGWGEVAEGSYQDFLLWLDAELNPTERNPALWDRYYQAETTIEATPEPGSTPKLFPGIRMGLQGEPFNAEKAPFQSIMTDDLIARSKFLMPVYACGYNWLASNDEAAKKLQTRIDKIIKKNNQGQFRCEQVILVTHSMGGLVARACSQLTGMDKKIAGIAHGVMPAVGAAVAYRRCKVGMWDEDAGAGLVIGNTGQAVTAVFAQAPGALQLLPSQTYASNWLRVLDNVGKPLVDLPAKGESPYEKIYKVRDKWWGLIDETWLAPEGGVSIKWQDYSNNIDKAEDFHSVITGSFHPNTYVYYGADKAKASFEKVIWRIKPGIAPDGRPRPTVHDVSNYDDDQLRGTGGNPSYVGGKTEVGFGFPFPKIYDTSYWELHCDTQDGVGDGTVPLSSGASPLHQGGDCIQQQFKLTGFGHEDAFKNDSARRATLYAIDKIAGKAKRPT
jgi:hypothetical protein